MKTSDSLLRFISIAVPSAVGTTVKGQSMWVIQFIKIQSNQLPEKMKQKGKTISSDLSYLSLSLDTVDDRGIG